MLVHDVIRWPVVRYRYWRARRQLLAYLRSGVAYHSDLRPNNILAGNGVKAPDAWPESGRKREQTWLIVGLALLALAFIWARKERNAKKARLIGRKACEIFDVFERLLPRRVVTEEFGDAREDIERMARAGECRRIYRRTVSTLWRGFWNSMDYWLS